MFPESICWLWSLIACSDSAVSPVFPGPIPWQTSKEWITTIIMLYCFLQQSCMLKFKTCQKKKKQHHISPHLLSIWVTILRQRSDICSTSSEYLDRSTSHWWKDLSIWPFQWTALDSSDSIAFKTPFFCSRSAFILCMAQDITLNETYHVTYSSHNEPFVETCEKSSLKKHYK